MILSPLLSSTAKAEDPSRAGIIWTGDMERGDLTGFYWHQNEPQVVAAPYPVRDGVYAMRSYLHRYESEWSYRTEVIVGADNDAPPDERGEFQFTMGEEYWIGLSIYIPDHMVIDTERLSDVVFQMQASPDPGEDYRSPVFALEVDADRWRIFSRWDTRETSPPGNDFTGEAVVYNDALGASIGRWTDWIVHVIWSWEDDGRLQVWRDGDLVVDRAGPNCSRDAAGPHPAFGLYKWSWRDDSYVHNTDWRLFYHDEFRIGDSRSSYADVAPSGGSVSGTPEPTPSPTNAPTATPTQSPTPTATPTLEPTLEPTPTAEAVPARLRLPVIEGETHQVLLVPITVDNGRDIMSLDVTVGFDQNVLEARGAYGDGLTANWPASSVALPGAISLSLASGGGTIDGSGVVGVLEFEVLGNAGDATPLSMLRASLNNGSLAASLDDGVFRTGEGSRLFYLPMMFQEYTSP